MTKTPLPIIRKRRAKEEPQYTIVLTATEVEDLFHKLAFKKNPIYVGLRKKLEKEAVCPNCGQIRRHV